MKMHYTLKPAFMLMLLMLAISPVMIAQRVEHSGKFTHADTVRGSLTPERAWWDVLRYDLEVRPDFLTKSIQGSNTIEFKIVNAAAAGRMQIDMRQPLTIDSISYMNTSLTYKREGNAYYVNFPKEIRTKHSARIKIYYSGKPLESLNPPWTGGWIFTRDKLGRPWMTVACEGLGASAWYPCKDWLGDEPDSGATLTITAPDTLVAVGNGRLIDKKMNSDHSATFKWAVINPINNYNIVPYIGKYLSWEKKYPGEKGELDCSYWVIDYNLDIAKRTFLVADSMLKCFEFWFGPYPFYEDGYKLVEAPYYGMEHQSAIAYGNGFRGGYDGRDVSGTGLGMAWDFIIVHESGHEWFGNNITAKDIGDQWIHETFTSYSETLFVEYYYGKQAANQYNMGIRKNILNKIPIIHPYGVNNEPSDNDEYYKGSNMLHTIRQVIANDTLFRQILRGLNKTFYHQTVTANQIENYISSQAKINFSKVFDQYLRSVLVPMFEYKLDGYSLSYRWSNCVPGFNMPLDIVFKGKRRIYPTTAWQNLNLYPEGNSDFHVDPTYYILSRQVNK